MRLYALLVAGFVMIGALLPILFASVGVYVTMAGGVEQAQIEAGEITCTGMLIGYIAGFQLRGVSWMFWGGLTTFLLAFIAAMRLTRSLWRQPQIPKEKCRLKTPLDWIGFFFWGSKF